MAGIASSPSPWAMASTSRHPASAAGYIAIAWPPTTTVIARSNALTSDASARVASASRMWTPEMPTTSGWAALQDLPEPAPIEAQVDDRGRVAALRESGGDVLEAERLGLEERREAEVDRGGGGLDEKNAHRWLRTA